MRPDQIKLQQFFEIPESIDTIREYNRLFLPLDEKWYNLFREGKKSWELRGINEIFNLKTIREGRTVELRRGYKADPIWGIITERLLVNSLEEIPSTTMDETIPRFVRDDPDVRAFLDEYREKYNKFILFKIKIVKGV